MNETIVSKDDLDELKLLSKGVVVCLEIMSSFSLDGKYIASDNLDRRMSTEQVNTLYESLYGKLTRLSFTRPKRLERMSTKRILKMICPAHSFIIGIYRNGTPDYRFKRMRVDESVSELIMLTVSEQEPHCEIITSVTDSFALTENPKSESLAICGVW